MSGALSVAAGAGRSRNTLRWGHALRFSRSDPLRSARSATDFLGALDPEVEFVVHGPRGPEVKARGRDRLRRLLIQSRYDWVSYRFDIDEARELSPGLALASGRFVGTPPIGEEVALEFACLWTLAGARAVRIEAFPSRERAIEAARQVRVDPPAARSSS